MSCLHVTLMVENHHLHPSVALEASFDSDQISTLHDHQCCIVLVTT